MNSVGTTSNQEWIDLAFEEAWGKAQKIIGTRQRIDNLAKWEKDPIGFCSHFFKEQYTDEAVEVARSVQNNVVTIARSANAVGKTFLAARLAIWFFSVYPDSKVFIAAAPPLDNLRNILWGELMTAIKKRPSLVADCRMKIGNQLLVQRSEENYISGLAIPTSGTPEEREAKFSGKHSPHMLFILDEGDAVPDEVYKGIDGCMSGGQMVRMLIMFNPRAKSGPVYLKESRGLANVVQLSAINHPNVIFGKDIIPGAVTRETTLRRVHMWTRPVSGSEADSGNLFVVPQVLAGISVVGLDGKEYPPLTEGDKRKIIEPAFSYMVLGEYPAQGATQLISEEWVDRARARWDVYVSTHGEIPPEGVKAVMGLDLAEFGTDSNIAALRYGSYVPRMRSWAGMDIDASTDYAMRIYNESNVSIVMVDATGIGSGVAPAMARRGRESDVRSVAVKVGEKPTKIIKSDLGEFQLLKDQLWWAMREWLRTDNGAMLPPEPLLLEELKAMSYEVTNYGKIRVTPKDVIRDRLKRSPDRADALALTFAPFDRAKWLRIDV